MDGRTRRRSAGPRIGAVLGAGALLVGSLLGTAAFGPTLTALAQLPTRSVHATPCAPACSYPNNLLSRPE